jgi:hypothetical protein
MEKRFAVFRDEVNINAATSTTLFEFITTADTPCTIYELSIDVENQTVANSVPTPMPQVLLIGSSTAMTSTTGATIHNIRGGNGTARTSVNTGTENFTSSTPTLLQRRVPATGSLWLPFPLGREPEIQVSTTSMRLRVVNTATGAIAITVSCSVFFAE